VKEKDLVSVLKYKSYIPKFRQAVSQTSIEKSKEIIKRIENVR